MIYRTRVKANEFNFEAIVECHPSRAAACDAVLRTICGHARHEWSSVPHGYVVEHAAAVDAIAQVSQLTHEQIDAELTHNQDGLAAAIRMAGGQVYLHEHVWGRLASHLTGSEYRVDHRQTCTYRSGIDSDPAKVAVAQLLEKNYAELPCLEGDGREQPVPRGHVDQIIAMLTK